ncbi:hypothetical protein ACC759_39015, partial [Rhizobium ruizarguesonis]
MPTDNCCARLRRRKGLVGGIERKESRAGKNDAGCGHDRKLVPPPHYCAVTTSILPVAVRAESSG